VHFQTKFLTTNVKGTDREMYLPVNFDIDPLPHLEEDLRNNYGWGLKMSEMYLRTAGASPRLLNYGGNGPLLTAYDADALQGRLGSYGNFTHENPGNSLIVTW
jgi:hypothetical protein